MRILFIVVFLIKPFCVFSQKWIRLADPPMQGRSNAIVYKGGDYVFVGTGLDLNPGGGRFSDVWRYDLKSKSWSQAYVLISGFRTDAIAFSIGDKGYIGLGSNLSSSSSFDRLLEHNVLTSSWRYSSYYPGKGIRECGAVSLNGKGYIGGGRSLGFNPEVSDEFWEYDPKNDTWYQRANLPFGKRFNILAFAIGNYIYIGLGSDGVREYNDMWRYDPKSGNWTQMANLPAGGRMDVNSFVVQDKAIVGGGRNMNGSIHSDYYEFNPITNSWKEICGFEAGQRAASVAFSVNDTGYVLLGTSHLDCYTDFWQFIPENTSLIDTFICKGEEIEIKAPVNGMSYLWNDSSSNSSLKIKNAGVYWVESDIDNCRRIDTFNVVEKPSPAVNLGADTTLCDGETLFLDANNNGATYRWQDNSTNATFTVTQAGTYYVDVDLNGCIATDTIIVAYQGDLAAVFVTDTIFCAGEELTLDARVQIPATYLWSDNSTASTLTVNDSAIYWVEISTQCDTLVDSIQVDLKNCACEFEAPNVFTPNGDGVNDYFYPKIKCQLLSYKMSIYNRWGDLVFFSNQPLLQWDGRVKNGKKASEGHYTYIIEYRDVLSGQKDTEKGNFLLLY